MDEFIPALIIDETKKATMEPKTTNQFPPKVLFKAEFITVACSGFEETSPQLPFVSESKKNDKQTQKFMKIAKSETLIDAFAPHLLQIISMHKNIIQLKTNPQSSARYLKFINSLFAIKFAQTTESVKNRIVVEGMFLRRILKSVRILCVKSQSFFIKSSL